MTELVPASRKTCLERVFVSLAWTFSLLRGDLEHVRLSLPAPIDLDLGNLVPLPPVLARTVPVGVIAIAGP